MDQIMARFRSSSGVEREFEIFANTEVRRQTGDGGYVSFIGPLMVRDPVSHDEYRLIDGKEFDDKAGERWRAIL